MYEINHQRIASTPSLVVAETYYIYQSAPTPIITTFPFLNYDLAQWLNDINI